MSDALLLELEAAPYRLLSDGDLERLTVGPSLFVLKRMIALRELERRRAIVASPLVALTSQN